MACKQSSAKCALHTQEYSPGSFYLALVCWTCLIPFSSQLFVRGKFKQTHSVLVSVAATSYYTPLSHSSVFTRFPHLRHKITTPQTGSVFQNGRYCSISGIFMNVLLRNYKSFLANKA